MYNFVVAQIFGIIGIILSVLSMQMKTKKNIMIMLLLLNLASALNFFFLNSTSGFFVCMFAVLETFINYQFDSKNKNVPIYVIIFYVVVNIVLGMISYHKVLDIVPVICALLFCATVCTKKEANIRKIMFANQSTWLVYDLIVKAYMFGISNVLTLISIIIAFFRYDYKKKS
ncbi:MAG: YgjV family protein [Bacilli bacterium]|nr:YgjV family protein [Bacilli bacterium]